LISTPLAAILQRTSVPGHYLVAIRAVSDPAGLTASARRLG
jgi:hypothetical protein